MAAKCERCGSTKGVKTVAEFVDRFQVDNVKACRSCARDIERENSGFQN